MPQITPPTNTPARTPHRDDAELFDHLREQLSPEAIVSIAAWLQPAATNNAKVNREVAWFQGKLIQMLGTTQYNCIAEDLGL